jgi:hypothetical protein
MLVNRRRCCELGIRLLPVLLAFPLAGCLSDDPDKWYNKTVLENFQGQSSPPAALVASTAPAGAPVVSDIPGAPLTPGTPAGPIVAAAPVAPATGYTAPTYPAPTNPAPTYPAPSYPAAAAPPALASAPAYRPPALPPQPGPTGPVALTAATGVPAESELYRSEVSCGAMPRGGAPPPLAAIQSVGLSMTECEVARRVGPADRVELSATPRGERLLTLTYVRGDHPHVYRFASGRLYSIDTLPVTAAPQRRSAALLQY